MMCSAHSCTITALLTVICITRANLLETSCTMNLCVLPTGEEFCYKSLPDYRKHENPAPLCSDHFSKYNDTIFLTIFDGTFKILPKSIFEQLDPNYVLVEDHKVPLTIEPLAFANKRNLIRLKLINCGLKSLPEDMLRGATLLIDFSLINNKIKSLPRGMLPDLAQLSALNLKMNEIEMIPQDMFKVMNNLSSLNLSWNKLSSLSRETFKWIPQLSEVYLNNNFLNEISDYLFIDLKKVHFLDLSDNQINNFTENAFYISEPSSGAKFGALEINTLELDGNRLYGSRYLKLAQTLLSNITMLTLLNLSRNEIDGKFKIMHWPARQHTVDLSYNIISTLILEEKTLELSEVQMNIQYNNITNVHFIEYDSEGSPSFPTVFIEGNPLHCDCLLLPLLHKIYDTKLLRHVFVEPGEAKCAAPPELLQRRVRGLRENELACSFKDRFCPGNCSCTERPHGNIPLELDCEYLPTESDFHHLPHNKTALRLRSIPKSFKILSPQVQFLNLTGLNLSQVPAVPDTVSDIDLTYNNLVHVPIHLLKQGQTLLRLVGNPFACECPNDDIVTLIQNYGKVRDYNNTRCADGVLVSSVDTQMCVQLEERYKRKVLITVGVVIITLLLVGAVLVVFFFRNRQAVYMYLYSRGWCLSCVTELDIDQDKVYDAFVTFSHDDRAYVIDSLVPGLEGSSHGYKLCLHYRDWIVGELITSQMVRSVMQSRRTIVVLSHNFLKSDWTQHEFKLAHSNATRDGCPRVIVILLEDVSRNERLAPELRSYLTTNTYIEKDDPRFWERLFYAMPHKVRHKRVRRIERPSDPYEIEMIEMS